MKNLSLVFYAVVFVLAISGTANAALTTIGTASYDSNGDGLVESYNLIYEDDSIDGGLVWLDYTRNDYTWQNQVNWASGLGSNLTVNLYSGYTTEIDWSTGWRLPLTDESQCNLSGGDGWEGPDASGYHNYRNGNNMVNSEMGHLYHESLGNLGYYAKDGTHPQPGYGLINTGDFNNLQSYIYWSGTEYSPFSSISAWYSFFWDGSQGTGLKDNFLNALAVHPGQVSAVPLPGAVWLLGSGVIGILGFRRKFKKEDSK